MPGRRHLAPQYVVLSLLCLTDKPDGHPMGEIVDGLFTGSTDATHLVDRLLSAGHVV
jgi:hypothetical protein